MDTLQEARDASQTPRVLEASDDGKGSSIFVYLPTLYSKMIRSYLNGFLVLNAHHDLKRWLWFWPGERP
jgi:hypothetical protein